MNYLRQIITMASITATETMRQPVCLLLTTVCIILTTAVPLITAHNFGDGSRLARDSGLAFQLMFGLFIAGYAACSTMERERKTGSMASVLSKSVGRPTFFISKFIGITAVIIFFSTCTSLATLLSERISIRYSVQTGFLIDFRTALLVFTSIIVACCGGAWLNYRKRLSFQSTSFWLLSLLMLLTTAIVGCFDRSGNWAPYNPQLQWQILSAASLITLGLIMLSAIALALAVRLSLTPVIFICLSLLITGLASDYIFSGHQSLLTNIFYIITPNWQNFWAADSIADNGHIPIFYIIHTTLYSLLYTSGILCLGAAVFKHSEIS